MRPAARLILCPWAAVIGLWLSEGAEAAQRSAAEIEACNAEFRKILGDGAHADTSAAQVTAWRALAPKCSGTGLYESRLVGLLTYSGQIEEARRAGKAALKQPLDSKQQLLVALAGIELQVDNFEGAIAYAKEVIASYPDWDAGYATLGEIHLSRNKCPEGVEALEKALELGQQASTAASLALGYWCVRRYEDSAGVMQAALEADDSVLRHTKAVAAAADSLVKIGRARDARDLLARHLQRVPAARQDGFFVRSEKIVDAALKPGASK